MPNHHDEGRRLRDLASNPQTDVFYTRHAEARMTERGISKLTVERVLKTGAVTNVEPTLRDERWTVTGNNVDGHGIQVVVVADESDLMIEVVTTY